jgi:hypothetical protein
MTGGRGLVRVRPEAEGDHRGGMGGAEAGRERHLTGPVPLRGNGMIMKKERPRPAIAF